MTRPIHRIRLRRRNRQKPAGEYAGGFANKSEISADDLRSSRRDPGEPDHSVLAATLDATQPQIASSAIRHVRDISFSVSGLKPLSV